MLILSFQNCNRCAQSFAGEIAQGTDLQCKRCRTKVRLCKSCKTKGCPECKGQLLNPWQRAKQAGGAILY
jgi:hypothetical protein